jgi:hypothetical protein
MPLMTVKGGRWQPAEAAPPPAGEEFPGNHLTRTTDPVITVWNRSGNPNPSGTTPTTVGQQLQVFPAGWDRSGLTSTAAEEARQTVLRQFWERRNNSGSAWAAITDPAGNVYQGGPYVTTEADAGKQISVRETVTDVNGTSSARSTIFSIGAGSLDSELVYQNDLTYIGAFRGPSNINYEYAKYGLRGLSYDPAGNGGAGSIFFSTNVYEPAGVGYGIVEMSVPTPVISANLDSLGSGGLIQGPFDSTEGQIMTSGIGAPPVGDRTVNGTLVYNGKVIVGVSNQYDGAFTPVSHFRRPRTLSASGAVESAWVGDVNGVYNFPRYTGGSMCHVPSAWQSALGGPCLTGVLGQSRNQSQSDGPCAWAFDPDAMAGKTRITGTCQGQSGMSSTQIRLAASATGIVPGMSIAFVSGTGTRSVPPDCQLRFVTAWDNATKVATVDRPHTVAAPDSTTQYVLFNRIDGRPLLFYPNNDNINLAGQALEDNNTFLGGIFTFAPAIWNHGHGGNFGMCIPNGTRTLLYCGMIGNGFARYNNDHAQYDPVYPVTGPRAYPYFIRMWAYDLNDLANVRSGSVASDSVRPYATWNMTISPNAVDRYVSGMTYDPVNRRLFISVRGVGNFGEAVIYAFTVNNAVGI